MVQYNLAVRATLSTVTGAGGGNKTLTTTELRSLVDGTTASGGVVIGAGDDLHINVDMGNRIYTDSFRLYVDSAAARATVASSIDFYYKDAEADSFTAVDTADNGIYYYANNVPTIFAPLEFKVTISGVAADVRELIVYNDDYDVAFGSDGGTTEYIIDDAPTGGSSTIHTIPIFNNAPAGNPSATAFVSIDYSTNEYDKYLKLSSDGSTFYNWQDGPSLKNDEYGEAYRWSAGTYTNTEQVGNSIELSPGETLGYYQTPLFQFNGRYGMNEITILTASGYETIPTHQANVTDQFSPSYVVVEETTVSGTWITTTSGVEAGTMEARSSNTAPEDVFEVCWFGRDPVDTRNIVVYRIDVLTGEVTKTLSKLIHSSYPISDCVCMSQSQFNGSMLFSVRIPAYGTPAYAVYYDYDFNLLRDTTGYLAFRLAADGRKCTHVDFQETGYAVLVNFYSGTLETRDFINNVLIKSEDDVLSWIREASAEPLGTSLWFISQLHAELRKYNEDYEKIATVPTPSDITLVSSTIDGGCWVYTRNLHTIYRYDRNGVLLTQINNVTTDEYPLLHMATDYLESDGVWVLTAVDVKHLGSDGSFIGGQRFVAAKAITTHTRGVVVVSEVTKELLVLDQNGEILFWKDFSAEFDTYASINATIFAYNHYDTLRYNHPGSMPRPSDPVWGTSGSLGWQEVPKNGYMLPKNRYHQFRFTLRSTTSGTTPKLDGVYMPMSVKIEDIYPQQSRPLYIKAEFEGVEDALYTSKLKCWWTK